MQKNNKCNKHWNIFFFAIYTTTLIEINIYC